MKNLIENLLSNKAVRSAKEAKKAALEGDGMEPWGPTDL